jgi:type 1 fimbria pilin
MRRLLAVLTGVFLLALSLGTVSAQTDKVVTSSGTVSAISSSSISIKSKSAESTFTIDSKTEFIGKGLGTKDAKMKEEKKAPQATDFIKVGDEVSVSFHETSKLATRVRVTKSAPPAK